MTTDNLTYKQFLSLQEKALSAISRLFQEQERQFLNERYSQIFWEEADDYEQKKQLFYQADLEVARGIINNCEKIREISADTSIDNHTRDTRTQALFDSHELMPSILN